MMITKLDQRGRSGTFDVFCRLWIDNRQLEFTVDYGLKIPQVASWLWLRRGVLIGKL